MPNSKILKIVFLSLIIIIFLGPAFYGCTQENKRSIKIGLAINLSGYSGTPAEDIEAGALLAEEQINKNGGINGHPIKLLVQDDKNSKEGILNADRTLIEAGCPVIIGHTYSQNTLIAYPFVMSKGKILFTAYTATTKLSGKDDLFFRTSVDNVLYGKAFGKLFQKEDIKNIVFLMDMSNESFCLDIKRQIEKNFDGHSSWVTINSHMVIDWDATIKKLMEYPSDAIIMLTEVKATAIACQKLRQRGYKGKFFGTIWTHGPKLLAYGGHAVEGLEIVTFLKPKYDNKMFKDFARKIKKKFGKQPTPKAARAYEAMFIIAEAMKKCLDNPTDVNCIKKEFLSTTFNYLLGTVKFDKYGDVIRPIYCIKVKNKQFMLKEQLL